MIKYKIILKTSHKNEGRIQDCYDTWLKHTDYVCLTDKYTNKFNEISCSERDDYNSNEEKTINFINLIKHSGILDNYDWLVFIDDDAILNKKYFEYILPYLDKEKFYGLCMGGCPQQPDVLFPSGGSGYLISPKLIRAMSDMFKPEWSTGGTEDVVVGNWLGLNNIKIHQTVLIDGVEHYFKLNGWFPFSPQAEKLTEEEARDPVIYVPRVIEYSKQEREPFLLSHLTHHYLRHREYQVYINEVLERWQPSDVGL